MENINQMVKCGYCNYFLGSFLNNILQHSCFQGFDSTIHEFFIADNGMVTMRDKTLHQSEFVKDSVDSLECPSDSQDQTCNEYCSQQSEQQSDDHDANESSALAIQSHDFSSGLHDELLISLVQNNPPLYDHRLPTVERTKLKKKDIWTAISNHFEGDLFTPTNAEKRWNYLRENYLKARKKFLESQYEVKKSGSAATSVVQPTYRYYQLMDFLNEPVTYKTTISSLKSKFKAGSDTRKSSSCSSKRVCNKENSNTDKHLNGNLVDEAYEYENQSENETFPMQAPQQQPLQSRQALSVLNTSNSTHVATRTSGFVVSSVHAASEESTSSAPPVKTPPLSNTPNLKKRRMSFDIENQLVQMLQKETKESDEVDGFLLRLGAGLRRLNFQRSRLEIKFLTMLTEEEEFQHM